MNQCWQYKIKKEKEFESKTYSLNIDYSDFEITQIEFQRARKFILDYEWIGNMGTSKYCFGLIFQDNLASVVCYGPPVSPTKYRKLLGDEVSNSIMQLCRGATSYWAPKWAPSKLISSSLRIINQTHGVQVVVAYADPEVGEVGTIYQACNAYYIGTTSPGGGKKYVIRGHLYDPRKVHKKFGSRSHEYLFNIDPSYYTIPIHKKHIYIFFTGHKSSKQRIINRIQHRLLPYPKR